MRTNKLDYTEAWDAVKHLVPTKRRTAQAVEFGMRCAECMLCNIDAEVFYICKGGEVCWSANGKKVLAEIRTTDKLLFTVTLL